MSCSDPRGSFEEGLKQFCDGLWDQPEASALQLATPPSNAPLNPESMDVHPPPLAQQPGTSQSSNLINADAAKAARIKESKRKSRGKKETERKENEKRLAELAKQNGVLLEANASLKKLVASIRAGDKDVREKFDEISKEAEKLSEETNMISKQSAANQVRLDLMFQIVKARAENDAAQTQILRELINGVAEPELKRAKLPEEKQEQRLIN